MSLRAASLLLLAACTGDTAGTTGTTDATGTTPPEPVEPAAEVGSGENEFEALADGDEILVVHGPQGGYHVYGSVRVQGVVPGDHEDLGDPDNPTVTFRVLWNGERLDTISSYTQGLDPTDNPDTFEMIGRLVILDILDDDEIVGEELELRVEVADVEGVVVDDARTVVAKADPRN